MPPLTSLSIALSAGILVAAMVFAVVLCLRAAREFRVVRDQVKRDIEAFDREFDRANRRIRKGARLTEHRFDPDARGPR